jgi:hypothetical protein
MVDGAHPMETAVMIYAQIAATTDVMSGHIIKAEGVDVPKEEVVVVEDVALPHGWM